MTSSTTKLMQKRWFWGLSLSSVVIQTLFWLVIGIITLTRTIPGWTIVDNNHLFFQVYAYLGGFLSLLTVLFTSILVFYYIMEDEEKLFEKIQLIGYIISTIIAYLVGLAFIWGYDERFDGSNPWGKSFVTTLEWKVFNFALSFCGVLMLLCSIYIFSQFVMLWPVNKKYAGGGGIDVTKH
jgi:ABC-type Fe3+-siderophore transport system permease subunit